MLNTFRSIESGELLNIYYYYDVILLKAYWICFVDYIKLIKLRISNSYRQS